MKLQNFLKSRQVFTIPMKIDKIFLCSGINIISSDSIINLMFDNPLDSFF